MIYSAVVIMLKNNVLHGDFHQGNFLLNIVSDKVELTIIDFGIICNITDEQS